MSLIEPRGAPPVSQAPARSFAPATPSRRGQPQAILDAFQDAVTRAENLRRMQNGREVVGIAACVVKLINSERQKAEHVIQAADRALAELEGLIWHGTRMSTPRKISGISGNGWRAAAPGEGCRGRRRELRRYPRSKSTL
jgi:hypothetical protein